MSKKRKVNPRKPVVKRATGTKTMGVRRKPLKSAGRAKVRHTSRSKYGPRRAGKK